MATSKTGSKSNRNCCVYGCNSIRKNTDNLMYHTFPKVGHKIVITDEFGKSELCERRTVWENKLQMRKKPSDHMTVCSLHFKEEDYTSSGWSSKKTLIRTAVPSQNLPWDASRIEKSVNQTKVDGRSLRKLRGKIKKVDYYTSHLLLPKFSAEESSSSNHQILQSNDVESETVDPILLCQTNMRSEINSEKCVKQCCDVGIQVDKNEFIKKMDCAVQVNISETITVSDFIHNDKQNIENQTKVGT